MVLDSEVPVKNLLLYDQLRGWSINIIATKISTTFPLLASFMRLSGAARLVLRSTPPAELDLEAGMKTFLTQPPVRMLTFLPHFASNGSEKLMATTAMYHVQANI